MQVHWCFISLTYSCEIPLANHCLAKPLIQSLDYGLGESFWSTVAIHRSMIIGKAPAPPFVIPQIYHRLRLASSHNLGFQPRLRPFGEPCNGCHPTFAVLFGLTLGPALSRPFLIYPSLFQDCDLQYLQNILVSQFREQFGL